MGIMGAVACAAEDGKREFGAGYGRFQYAINVDSDEGFGKFTQIYQ